MTAKAQERTSERIAWIDYARGLSIILVVMMHSTLGVEASLGRDGWLHEAVSFAKPFRIPAFFLVSGLLVSRVIDRDWRSYLDSRVLHFVYFYVLWVTIQFLFKFPGFAVEQGILGAVRLYLEAFVQPFGTLWFIYLLPIFFLVVKLLRRVPPVLVWSAAALLETMHLDTGSVVIDEFASRFVFFYSGYVLAQYAFRLASWSERHRHRRHCRCRGLAAVQWRAGLLGSFRAAVHFANAGFPRRRGHHRGLGAAGAKRARGVRAFLRREFAADLSRLFPSDGGGARR